MPEAVLRVVGCDQAREWEEVFEPSLPGAARASGQSYECGDLEVGHFVAVFDDPVGGSELVNRQHRYWPNAWTPSGTRSDREIETTTGALAVGELSLEQSGQTRLVWYVYSIGDNVTANRYSAKFWEAVYTVGGQRAAGRLDIVTASAPGDPEAIRARLGERLALERK